MQSKLVAAKGKLPFVVVVVVSLLPLPSVFQGYRLATPYHYIISYQEQREILLLLLPQILKYFNDAGWNPRLLLLLVSSKLAIS